MSERAPHSDDFADAFQTAFARLQIVIETACAPEPDWPRRVAAAIRAALEFAAAHPDEAGLLTNGALAAGREGFERYDRMLDHFARALRPGREQRPHGRDLPEVTDKAMVGGLASLIANRLDTAPGLLRPLAPEAIQFVLTPYLGAEEARRIGAEAG